MGVTLYLEWMYICKCLQFLFSRSRQQHIGLSTLCNWRGHMLNWMHFCLLHWFYSQRMHSTKSSVYVWGIFLWGFILTPVPQKVWHHTNTQMSTYTQTHTHKDLPSNFGSSLLFTILIDHSALSLNKTQTLTDLGTHIIVLHGSVVHYT